MATATISLQFGFATEQEHTCERDSQELIPKLKCSSGETYYFEDPVAVLNPKTGAFDTYCSYRGVRESKSEMRNRLITEDLFRIANGQDPRCFTESAIGNARKKEKDEIKEALDLVNSVPSESLKGLGRSTPPAQCIDPQVKANTNNASDKPVTKRITFNKNKSPEEKKRIKEEQRRKLRVPNNRSNPPNDIYEAFVNVTKNWRRDPTRKLEVCIAFDASGSMGDDVAFLHARINELRQVWDTEYKGGVTIHAIEFGQDQTEKLELREKVAKSTATALASYLKDFKLNGGFEPTFDAIVNCAQRLASSSTDTELRVIVLSDEPGDRLSTSPTEEQAVRAVAAKGAELYWIDPNTTTSVVTDLSTDKRYTAPPNNIIQNRGGELFGKDCKAVFSKDSRFIGSEYSSHLYAVNGSSKECVVKLVGASKSIDLPTGVEIKKVAVSNQSDTGIIAIEKDNRKLFGLIGEKKEALHIYNFETKRFDRIEIPITIDDNERASFLDGEIHRDSNFLILKGADNKRVILYRNDQKQWTAYQSNLPETNGPDWGSVKQTPAGIFVSSFRQRSHPYYASNLWLISLINGVPHEEILPTETYTGLAISSDGSAILTQQPTSTRELRLNQKTGKWNAQDSWIVSLSDQKLYDFFINSDGSCQGSLNIVKDHSLAHALLRLRVQCAGKSNKVLFEVVYNEVNREPLITARFTGKSRLELRMGSLLREFDLDQIFK